MIYTHLTNLAMKIMYEAHDGVFDKSGVPYAFHPYHLAEQMDDEISVCVALLHDVVEDSAVSFADLEKAGFPSQVIDAVRLLTHNAADTYPQYIEKIKDNELARKVKLADLHHNSDLSRFDVIDEAAMKRLEKYRLALEILN